MITTIDTDYHYHSIGACSGCPVCQQDFGMDESELDAALSFGSVCAESEFSWCACEWCGSTLGGDREPAHAVNKETGDIEHFMVCTDCVMAGY